MSRTSYILFVYLLISVAIFGNTFKQKISELRVNYYKAVEEEEYIDTVRSFIKANFESEEISENIMLKAYEAAIVSVKAKHAFWPFSKMTYLNESMELFAEVVSEAPDNLEIRFLRFSILHYVPGILGFSDERDEDLLKIVEMYSRMEFDTLPEDLIEGVYEFVIDSDRLDENQVNQISKYRSYTNIN